MLVEITTLVVGGEKWTLPTLFPRCRRGSLERFSNLGVYAVESLMPDRPKVRFQTKRDTGVYAVCGRSRFTSGTRLFIRRDCASKPEAA